MSVGADLRILRKTRPPRLVELVAIMERSVGCMPQVERDISQAVDADIETLANALAVSPSSPGRQSEGGGV